MSLNGFQMLIVIFAVICLTIYLWSIVAVILSPTLKLKPLWIIGCSFGFIGLGINWTTPDDIVLLFGVVVPPILIFKFVATGQVIVKTGFPILSLVALEKA